MGPMGVAVVIMLGLLSPSVYGQELLAERRHAFQGSRCCGGNEPVGMTFCVGYDPESPSSPIEPLVTRWFGVQVGCMEMFPDGTSTVRDYDSSNTADFASLVTRLTDGVDERWGDCQFSLTSAGELSGGQCGIGQDSDIWPGACFADVDFLRLIVDEVAHDYTPGGATTYSYDYAWQIWGASEEDCRILPPRGYSASTASLHVGDEIVVADHDHTIMGGALRLAVGMSDSGESVVVWKETSESDLTNRIRARRVDAAGTPLGPSFNVSSGSDTSFRREDPDVAVEPSGGFMVVWKQDREEGVHGRVYDATGVPLGPEFQVNNDTSTYAYPPPHVAASKSPALFVVAWESGYEGALRVRQFDHAGTPVSGEFEVSPGGSSSPEIAAAADGRFVIAWNAGAVSEARWFHPWGAPMAPVATLLPGYLGKVAMNESGHFGVVAEGLEAQEYATLARRFDAEGAALGPSVVVSELVSTRLHAFPDVAVDGANDVVVVFAETEEQGGPPGQHYVRIQLYDAYGLVAGPPSRLNTVPVDELTVAEFAPRVAVNEAGHGIVAWNDGSRIYARLFDVETTPLSGVTVGRGTFSVTESFTTLPPFPLAGGVTFEDVDFDVFGQPVNLGMSVGAMDLLSGTAGDFAGDPPTTTFSVMADAPSVMSFDIDGSVICVSPNCADAFDASFVGLLSNMEDPTSILPADPAITYVDDGFVQCMSAGVTAECAGTFALNAFRGTATPASSEPSSLSFTYLIDDPLVGADQAISVIVQFASVETPGVTLATSQSNSPSVGIGVGAELTERFDLSTTASVSGPIRVCVYYEDDNADSVVKFLGETVSECSLRFYHEEDVGNGPELVDRTLEISDPLCPTINPLNRCRPGTGACLDPVQNRICGKVDSLSAFAIGGARPVPVAARKLVVVDKGAVADKAKVVFVSKDATAGITKGTGTGVESITARVDVEYGSAHGAFIMPAGAGDGTSGWLANKASVAKFVNKGAPAGPTGAKAAVVKPGKLLKLVAKNLGDEPIDLEAQGPPSGPVYVTYRIANGADAVVHCSQFPPTECAFKEIAGGAGRKLVCKNGQPGECG